ncbi:MAG: hypothetical protein JWN41_1448, partial [Thermoleophilia bacterium]|nr:hypothetical protein [Thermoleophilia bacterium]
GQPWPHLRRGSAIRIYCRVRLIRETEATIDAGDVLAGRAVGSAAGRSAMLCVMTRLLLVTNAHSGSADAVDPGNVLRERGHEVERVSIERVDELTRHIDAAPELRNVRRIVVAGGDGSIAPVAVLAARLDVPLGVVPAGTANDFARALQLPDDVAEAVLLAGDGAHTRAVTVGMFDDRPFVNVVSVGVAPTAAEAASTLKSRLGALAYPVGAIIGAARSKPVELAVRVDDDEIFRGAAWQAMVANTGAFGGWAETGGTDLDDRRLALIVVPAKRRMRRLVVDIAAVVRGELADRDGVHHARGTEIVWEFATPPDVVIDGETVRASGRLVVSRPLGAPLHVVTG